MKTKEQMDDNSVSRTVTVVNPEGVHARPADMFARTASRFSSEIQVSKNGQSVDGKSILGILTLAAEEGSQLEIDASGEDAAQAIDALAQLVQAGFTEDQNIRG